MLPPHSVPAWEMTQETSATPQEEHIENEHERTGNMAILKLSFVEQSSISNYSLEPLQKLPSSPLKAKKGAREMAQLVKYLLGKNKNPSLDPWHPYEKMAQLSMSVTPAQGGTDAWSSLNNQSNQLIRSMLSGRHCLTIR